MKINGENTRTIWVNSHAQHVNIIDQTLLPHRLVIEAIVSVEAMVHAINTMQVRGAPLIGVAAAYGIALAMQQNNSDAHLNVAAMQLLQSRPTAVNLKWAVNRMMTCLQNMPCSARNSVAWHEAAAIADEDVVQNQAIGQHGLSLIQHLYQNKTLNILTHCNAGWLATVDYGTALAPIYAAHDAGLNVHVWVDETRPAQPRCQFNRVGARTTRRAAYGNLR